MYDTYKMMYNCTNSTYLDKELEQLVEDYKATERAGERSKIVAAMFIKVFPMIKEIQSKYYSLTNEQKVEHALQHLVRSIKYYKNNNVKFSSFYYTHLSNQMKTLLTSENSLKKAAFQNIVRDNDNVLKWYAKNEPSKNMEMSESYFLENLKNSSYLSLEEKEYCSLVLAGYDKMQIISDKLDLKNRMNIATNPIKRVKIDEQDSSEMNIEKQAELERKRELRRVRKIRQSIKDKFVKYGMDIFG